jgi:GT2 family glycosyltransferase
MAGASRPDWGQWPAPSIGARLQGALEAGLGLPARSVPAAGPLFTAALRPLPREPKGAPLVSLAILNLNGAALMRRLLSSLERFNRYATIEIIVVDHGSSDDSVAAIEEWQGRLPILLVACRDNYSFAFSCNRAAEIARGEFLLLVNNDIEWSAGLIDRMVAALQANVGVAGIKLQEGGAIGHIGVRFDWYPKLRFVGNYNAAPAPGDEALAAAPAAFPAVTGAVMMCRREEYLRFGGLSEAYAYGYEDIDYCVKARLGAGQEVVSLNDVAAVHGDGRTRYGEISRARHDEWRRHNRAMFARRCGYAIRREAWAKLFADDGSYWGRRPTVAFVATAERDWAKAKPLAERLGAEFAWPVKRLRQSWRGLDLTGIDLLMICDEALDLRRLRHRHPAMLSLAWGADETARPPFDGATAATEPAALRDALLRILTERHRIVIKATPESDRAVLTDLAAALRGAGQIVRIDPPARWNAPDTIRDDVVLIFDGAEVCAPQGGKINLTLGGARAGEPEIDRRLALSEPAALARTVLDAVAALHPARLRGPSDPPLTSRAQPPGRTIAGWEGQDDRLRALLGTRRR